MTYWGVLSAVSLPIFLTCCFGALLQKWQTVDTNTLANVSLYILAPGLVIFALAQSKTNGHEIGLVAAFTVLTTALYWILGAVAVKLFRIPSDSTSALLLTTMFGNSNNYGLPVLLLAYGSAGFSLGATYVIGQIILVNTLGVYIASRSQVTPKQAVEKVLRAPLIYATLAGIAICATEVHVPNGIMSSLKLVGDAYPAVVLIILGIQLGNMRVAGIRRPVVWIAVLLRLVLVPGVSIFVLHMVGIHGLLASVLFVQSSMPAAINSSVLVEKYGGDKELVSLTVAVTTIFSFLTLPFLITLG